MTPSELKFQYESKNPNGRFFSRENMKFANDTMANFGCVDGGEYWILHRKKGYGQFKFEKETFKYLGVIL